MKCTKPIIKIRDRVRISKKEILFRKGYTPHFTDEVFEILAISTKKTSNIHPQRSQKRRKSGKIL